jgi:hypothetical protein
MSFTSNVATNLAQFDDWLQAEEEITRAEEEAIAADI